MVRGRGRRSFTNGGDVDHALPIHARREEIATLARNNRILIVVGQTGCGKTTLLPRFLYEDGLCGTGMIGVAVPRRIAAIGAADYVSQSVYKEPAGGFVGYQIRNERVVDDKSTKIKYMTYGVLLREIASDPLLTKYKIIVLDETHERNVDQEVLMALLRDIARKRQDDFRLIIMSATIDEKKFSDYFRAPIITIEGRRFPVEVEFSPREVDDIILATAETVISGGLRTDGDILVFVPDYEAIEKVIVDLRTHQMAQSMFADFLPLYGNQSSAEHRAIYARHDGDGPRKRFVIVATNIAETSITLDGVTAVVDTGIVKQMSYSPRTRYSTLARQWHSQAGCAQRWGRCGRTAPGLVLCLYTQEQYEAMDKFTTPEIRRSDLSQVSLQLLSAGFTFGKIVKIPFMSRPSDEAWGAAILTLLLLGAIDPKHHALTPEGKRMAAIPLPPAMAKIVLSACPLECMQWAIIIAASFVTHRVFLRPPGEDRDVADAAHERFADKFSDFVALCRAYREWKTADDQEAFAKTHYLHHAALVDIDKTASTVMTIMSTLGENEPGRFMPERIGMAIATGLAPLTLLRYDGDKGFYRMPDGKPVSIFPGSFLRDVAPPDQIVAAEIVYTQKRYALNVQAVPDSWLKHLPRPEIVDDSTLFEGRRGRNKPKKEKKDRYHNRR